MSPVGRKNFGRVLAELALLIIGVLVALAVDRWIGALETQELEHTYLLRLEENLRADSAALETQVARAEEKMGWADDLFAALDGHLPTESDAGVFLARLDRMPIWTPFDATREAWDDIVATGNLRVLQDVDLRQMLSAYYNAIEREQRQAVDMDGQLTAIEMSTWPVLEPSRRLAIVLSPDRPSASLGEVRAALERIRGDRVLHARLVQAKLMHEVVARRYQGLVESSSAVLSRLQDAAN